MEDNTVLLVAVLDRSGSMAGRTQEVISGFNGLKSQQTAQNDGDTLLTLTIFDDQIDRLYTATNLRYVPDLTSEQFWPRGNTALLDAVGRTIKDVAKMPSLPKKIVFVIATDGFENASREFTKQNIADLVKKYEGKKRNPWAFIFMGAGVDAFSDKFGFTSVNRTLNVSNDRRGYDIFYAAVGQTMSATRDGSYTPTMDISGLSNMNYGNNPIPSTDTKITVDVKTK